MGMKTLETMMEKTQFELEFPIIQTSSSDGMIIETFDYHLSYYKVRIKLIQSQMDNYAGLECYYLNVDAELQN